MALLKVWEAMEVQSNSEQNKWPLQDQKKRSPLLGIPKATGRNWYSQGGYSLSLQTVNVKFEICRILASGLYDLNFM